MRNKHVDELARLRLIFDFPVAALGQSAFHHRRRRQQGFQLLVFLAGVGKSLSGPRRMAARSAAMRGSPRRSAGWSNTVSSPRRLAPDFGGTEHRRTDFHKRQQLAAADAIRQAQSLAVQRRRIAPVHRRNLTPARIDRAPDATGLVENLTFVVPPHRLGDRAVKRSARRTVHHRDVIGRGVPDLLADFLRDQPSAHQDRHQHQADDERLAPHGGEIFAGGDDPRLVTVHDSPSHRRSEEKCPAGSAASVRNARLSPLHQQLPASAADPHPAASPSSCMFPRSVTFATPGDAAQSCRPIRPAIPAAPAAHRRRVPAESLRNVPSSTFRPL